MEENVEVFSAIYFLPAGMGNADFLHHKVYEDNTNTTLFKITDTKIMTPDSITKDMGEHKCDTIYYHEGNSYLIQM